MAVGVVERLQHGVHHSEHLRQRQHPGADAGPQRGPADVLENDVVGIADLLQVVDLDDVRVGRAGHDLRLLHESRKGGRVGVRIGDQLLDRDLAAEPGLLGEVYGAHAAPPQLPLDHVLADMACFGRAGLGHATGSLADLSSVLPAMPGGGGAGGWKFGAFGTIMRQALRPVNHYERRS